jgi:uncharacterized surface protein with fasciclin (FAS1) repeats
MICVVPARAFLEAILRSRTTLFRTEGVMKKSLLMVMVLSGLILFGCEKQEAAAPGALAIGTNEVSNLPPLHETNIVSLAIASKDHTTLVTALKAADYVTSVAASGPLTVFAPTNAAFDKLPEGTVENLLKPENVDQLRNILKYHVTTSALAIDSFKDGQIVGMVNGKKVTMHVKDGKVSINDANIIASSPASNGMLHIIDVVLLPPED